MFRSLLNCVTIFRVTAIHFGRAPVCEAWLLLWLVIGGLTAYPSSAAEPGHWQEQKLDLTYVGLTTFYSCTGIEGKLETVLAELGAHPKPSVAGICDLGTGYPSRVSGAWLKFSTLVPDSQLTQNHNNNSSALDSAQVVMGQWQTVVLERNPRLGLDDGDCELMETLYHTLIPKMSVQVNRAEFRCMPHDVTYHSYYLSLNVFKPQPDAQHAKTQSVAKPQKPDDALSE